MTSPVVQPCGTKRPRGRPRKYPRPDENIDPLADVRIDGNAQIDSQELIKDDPTWFTKLGRPAKYPLTEDVREEIISKLMDGEMLSQMCENNPRYNRGRVERWRKTDPTFDSDLQMAREIGADTIAEGLLRMIDEQPDTIGNGANKRLDPGAVQWQRNRVEVRMRLLAMWFPKKYSQRAGSVGDGAISVSVVTGVPSPVAVAGSVCDVTIEGNASHADHLNSGSVAACSIPDAFRYDV